MIYNDDYLLLKYLPKLPYEAKIKYHKVNNDALIKPIDVSDTIVYNYAN